MTLLALTATAACSGAHVAGGAHAHEASTVLGVANDTAKDLLVDDDGTIWLIEPGPGVIERMSRGEAPHRVATVSGPTYVAADASTIYVVEGADPGTTASKHARIVAIAKRDGARRVVADGIYDPGGLAVAGGMIYYTASANATVRALPIAGGDEAVIDTSTYEAQPHPIAANDRHVAVGLWTESAAAAHVMPPVGGVGQRIVIDAPNLVGAVALDGDDLIYATTDTRARSILTRRPIAGAGRVIDETPDQITRIVVGRAGGGVSWIAIHRAGRVSDYTETPYLHRTDATGSHLIYDGGAVFDVAAGPDGTYFVTARNEVRFVPYATR